MAAHGGDPASSGWLDIHGTSEDDVFAVGHEGQIFHFDGSDWVSMDSGTDEELNSVWAIAPNDVYATSYDGGMLHYDGVEWTTLLSGSSGLVFRHVFGFDAETLIAPSYDGERWTHVGLARFNGEMRVFAVGPREVYVSAWGGVYRFTVPSK